MKVYYPRQQISCGDDPSRGMETEQEIFRRGLYVREAGVVALPQAPAQWTPIRMAAAGWPLRLVTTPAGPPRQAPEENFRWNRSVLLHMIHGIWDISWFRLKERISGRRVPDIDWIDLCSHELVEFIR